MKKFLVPMLLSGLLLSCSDNDFEPANDTESHFHLQVDEHTVPILVRGNTASGKILLYVQGGPGYNSLDFAEIDYPEWKETLEKEYAVAYYDQYGMGNRQGKIDLDRLNTELMLNEMHEVAGFLKAKYKAEIILLGHSFGGVLTMRYMMRYEGEETVSKFINMNGAASTDDDTVRWRLRRDFLVNLASLEIRKGRNADEWKACKTWLDENPKLESLEQKWAWNDYVNELIEPLYDFKSPGAGDYVNVIFSSPYNVPTTLGNSKISDRIQEALIAEEKEFGLISRLDEVKGDLLILTGRLDDICPPEELEYMFTHLTNARVDSVTLPMAGHDAYLDQKEKYTQAIVNFVGD